MRRVYLLICLLAVAFLFLYSPENVKSATFCDSFNAGNCPTPECKVESRTVAGACSQQAAQSLVCVANSDAVSYCYPENTLGIIKSNEEGNKNAVFVYEGLQTKNWKFKASNSGPQIFVPRSFDGAVSSSPQIIFEVTPNPPSNTPPPTLASAHCKYYEFPFK